MISEIQKAQRDLYYQLPRWHRIILEELRTKVLLQAIRDASEVELPPNIRSMLNQVEFFLETQGYPQNKDKAK